MTETTVEYRVKMRSRTTAGTDEAVLRIDPDSDENIIKSATHMADSYGADVESITGPDGKPYVPYVNLCNDEPSTGPALS